MTALARSLLSRASVKKEAVMKKNLLSLKSLMFVAVATLAATSPALAGGPQIPPSSRS